MMPTERSCEALFPQEESILGELKLEILEARNLPQMDAVAGLDLNGNLTDTYAFIVFAGARRAHRSCATFEPQWGAMDLGSFRAFRFPVLQPCLWCTSASTTTTARTRWPPKKPRRSGGGRGGVHAAVPEQGRSHRPRRHPAGPAAPGAQHDAGLSWGTAPSIGQTASWATSASASA